MFNCKVETDREDAYYVNIDIYSGNGNNPVFVILVLYNAKSDEREVKEFNNQANGGCEYWQV